MNVYVCTDHLGRAPVCSLVVAATEQHARHLLIYALDVAGIVQGNKPFTLQRIDTTNPRAQILICGEN